MAQILIIGYGNPFKSDDGAGWHAAALLRSQISSAEIMVIQAHQLTPEMAEEAGRAELVLFLDARQGGQPGELSCETLGEDAGQKSASSHDFSPASVLKLAQELYGKQPRAYLLTLTGQNFEDGEVLSERVFAALPGLVAKAKSLISDG
jgi:hydrogenase maturation protease